MSQSGRSPVWGLVFLALGPMVIVGGLFYRHFTAGNIRANCVSGGACRSDVCISGQCQVRCSTDSDCPKEYECSKVDLEIVRKHYGIVSREASHDQICVWKTEPKAR